MITLEQIKLLEQKVEAALHKIVELQNENASLKSENEDLQTEIELLQEECKKFVDDESKIEKGILSVIERLNTVEDTVRQTQSSLQHNQISENTLEPVLNKESSLLDIAFKESTAQNTVSHESINEDSDESLDIF